MHRHLKQNLVSELVDLHGFLKHSQALLKNGFAKVLFLLVEETCSGAFHECKQVFLRDGLNRVGPKL
jgi:hypothetical protein